MVFLVVETLAAAAVIRGVRQRNQKLRQQKEQQKKEEEDVLKDLREAFESSTRNMLVDIEDDDEPLQQGSSNRPWSNRSILTEDTSEDEPRQQDPSRSSWPRFLGSRQMGRFERISDKEDPFTTARLEI